MQLLLRRLPAALVVAAMLALTACNVYQPSSGLKITAETACSGYWQGHTNGYPYGDPRLRYWQTWVNTDRRVKCGG